MDDDKDDDCLCPRFLQDRPARKGGGRLRLEATPASRQGWLSKGFKPDEPGFMNLALKARGQFCRV